MWMYWWLIHLYLLDTWTVPANRRSSERNLNQSVGNVPRDNYRRSPVDYLHRFEPSDFRHCRRQQDDHLSKTPCSLMQSLRILWYSQVNMPTDLGSVGVRRRDVGSCKILTQLFHDGFLQQAMYILFLDLKLEGVDKGALRLNLNVPDNYNIVSSYPIFRLKALKTAG